MIHDTLTIFGSLTIGDTLDLSIDPTGVLIIRGDFLSGDTVDVWNSGEMVVTGDFSIVGDNDQGFFDNDGLLHVFDSSPVHCMMRAICWPVEAGVMDLGWDLPDDLVNDEFCIVEKRTTTKRLRQFCRCLSNYRVTAGIRFVE